MSKKIALIFLLIWPPVASFISFATTANFFTSAILFLGLPALILSFFNKKIVLKTSIIVLAQIPVGLILDYIMEKTQGWVIPQSIFGSFRVFDWVTVDALVWFSLYLYLIILFYQTFLKKDSTNFLSPRFKYLLIISLTVFALFIFLHLSNPTLLFINYFYLKFGLILVILPITLILLKSPRLWSHFTLVAFYFFYLSLIYELTGLYLNQWFFPVQNQHIGYVVLFNLRFAFEEFIFWISLGAPAVLSVYEYFNLDSTWEVV